MNKILEKIIEPDDIYAGSFFKLKVKIEPDTIRNLTWEEMRQLTYQEVNDLFTFETLKGDTNGRN